MYNFLYVSLKNDDKVQAEKLTSAKIKGASYFLVSSPSLMAFNGAGPQQKTPDGITHPETGLT